MTSKNLLQEAKREKAGWHLAQALLSIVVGWLLIVALSPLFIDGNIYHIDSPAPVTVHGDNLFIEIEVMRHAKLDMPGECTLELECNDFIYEYDRWACPIEKGGDLFIRTIELPLAIARHIDEYPGDKYLCQVRGLVEYEPLGPVGPSLRHTWYTEEFVLDSN